MSSENESGAVLFEQERKRTGGYIEAQWKPNRDLPLNLSGFYSTVDAKNYNTNYMADVINPVNGPGWNGVAVKPTGAATVSGNTITSIFFDKNVFGPSSAGAFSVVEDVAGAPSLPLLPLAALAALLLAGGMLLRPFYGINKIDATAPCALVCSGLTLGLFLLFYWLCDVRGWRRWCAWLLPAGGNALFA